MIVKQLPHPETVVDFYLQAIHEELRQINDKLTAVSPSPSEVPTTEPVRHPFEEAEMRVKEPQKKKGR